VGTVEAANVLFEILPDGPFSLQEGDETLRYLGTIEARQVGKEAYILYYKLMIAEDAVEGNNEIAFRYSKDGGRSWIRLDPFYVRIETLDAIVSVDKVVLSPSEASPGDRIQVLLDVVNHADSLVKDLTFTMELDGLPFAPEDSTNEKILYQLDGRESGQVLFSLLTQVDAESKVYSIPLEITYLDEIGNHYNKTNNIGVVVNDEPQFIVNIDETEIYTRKSKGKVIISLSNIGTSELKYLTMEILESEDYSIISTPTVYLGNLDGDDFDSASYTMYVSAKKDQVPLKLQITYKDSFNAEFTEFIEIEMPLYSSSEAKKFGVSKSGSLVGLLFNLMVFVVLTAFWLFMVMECVRTPMMRYKKIIWVVLVIGGYVIGAALYYFMKKKKKSDK
jgi:hypothetical protein